VVTKLGNSSMFLTDIARTIPPSQHARSEIRSALPICNDFVMCRRCRLSRRKQVVEEYFETAHGVESPTSVAFSREHILLPFDSLVLNGLLRRLGRPHHGGVITLEL
jgi:hypothetical protein